MSRGTHHPPELVAEAIRRHFEGESLSTIARALGVPKPTVGWWINKNDPIKKLAVAEQHRADVQRSSRKIKEAGGSYREDQAGPYRRDQAELGAMVYDAVMATLESIRARAIETGRPQWIRKQSADQLAALATSEWTQVIRLVSAFRPATDMGAEGAREERGEAGGEAGQSLEPEVHRNGALGTAT